MMYCKKFSMTSIEKLSTLEEIYVDLFKKGQACGTLHSNKIFRHNWDCGTTSYAYGMPGETFPRSFNKLVSNHNDLESALRCKIIGLEDVFFWGHTQIKECSDYSNDLHENTRLSVWENRLDKPEFIVTKKNIFQIISDNMKLFSKWWNDLAEVRKIMSEKIAISKEIAKDSMDSFSSEQIEAQREQQAKEASFYGTPDVFESQVDLERYARSEFSFEKDEKDRKIYNDSFTFEQNAEQACDRLFRFPRFAIAYDSFLNQIVELSGVKKLTVGNFFHQNYASIEAEAVMCSLIYSKYKRELGSDDQIMKFMELMDVVKRMGGTDHALVSAESTAHQVSKICEILSLSEREFAEKCSDLTMMKKQDISVFNIGFRKIECPRFYDFDNDIVEILKSIFKNKPLFSKGEDEFFTENNPVDVAYFCNKSAYKLSKEPSLSQKLMAVKSHMVPNPTNLAIIDILETAASLDELEPSMVFTEEGGYTKDDISGAEGFDESIFNEFINNVDDWESEAFEVFEPTEEESENIKLAIEELIDKFEKARWMDGKKKYFIRQSKEEYMAKSAK